MTDEEKKEMNEEEIEQINGGSGQFENPNFAKTRIPPCQR